jgi:hypothetical protein
MVKTQLKLCKVKKNGTAQQEKSSSYPSYPDYYETRLVYMFFIELVPFTLIPCACLIGLFLNYKIIMTIKKNRKKELKEDFYKYMSVNA